MHNGGQQLIKSEKNGSRIINLVCRVTGARAHNQNKSRYQDGCLISSIGILLLSLSTIPVFVARRRPLVAIHVVLVQNNLTQ
jgi:hypothetical protein